MSEKSVNFGETIIEFGRACGSVVETQKGFIRKYLIENMHTGDAIVVKVFAHELKQLPDDPTGMCVRFKDVDFVFAV